MTDSLNAARRYAEAMETFHALGEPQQEATCWHGLGFVAEKTENWGKAERCYREAVRIYEQIGHLPGLARVLKQLAIVAEGAGRLDDAERWYLRALEVFEQLKDPAASAKVLNNLAALYLSQGRLDEAARYARRAVDIVEQHHIQTEVWKMYSLLAQIAEAQGRTDEAARWRRKEQEGYAAYAGAAHEMQRYQPLIQAVVAACQVSKETQSQLEPALQRMENIGEVNRRFAQAARRILDGERDAETLTANLERISATMVRTILAQLAGEAPRTPGVSPPQTPGVLETPGVSETSEAITQLRQQWAPVVQAVVAACRGDKAAAALRRVLAGERDPDLSALPPQVADGIRSMLEALK